MTEDIPGFLSSAVDLLITHISPTASVSVFLNHSCITSHSVYHILVIDLTFEINMFRTLISFLASVESLSNVNRPPNTHVIFIKRYYNTDVKQNDINSKPGSSPLRPYSVQRRLSHED